MIDKVYLINLPECEERRRHMDKELRAVGFPSYEIHGVSGRQLSEERKAELNRERLAFYRDEFGQTVQPLTRGQLGCYLTHAEIHQDMVDRHIECALVVEDDIRFNEHIKELPGLLRQLAEVDSAWDYVYLNCVANRWSEFDWTRLYWPDAYVDQPTCRPNVVRSGLSFGSNSQIITYRGAEKLVRVFRHPLEPVDLQLHIGHSSRDYFQDWPKLNLYAFHPYVTDELEGQTSFTQGYQ